MEAIKHIHEVLFIFQELESFKNEDALIKEIHSRFGEGIQFVSCSNIPFGVEEVVPFLKDRQKIIQKENGELILHPSMTMCDGHEKSHH